MFLNEPTSWQDRKAFSEATKKVKAELQKDKQALSLFSPSGAYTTS